MTPDAMASSRTNDRYDAIVIGAGHNGLVTAAYLSRKGLRTVVLERSERAGGCAATEELWPGYLVDIGAHQMGTLDPRVTSDLRLEGIEYVDPDPVVTSLLPDGATLSLYRDQTRTIDEIERFSPRDAERWPGFVSAMTSAARTIRVFYEATPPRIAGADRGDLWELARLGMKLGRIGRAEAVELMRLLPMTIEELLDEWFESEPLKGVLGARACRGISQGPYAAGTAFTLIHALATGDVLPGSTRWVRGGMTNLGVALATAATAAGAEIRTGVEVARIRVTDGRTTGVELSSGDTIDGGLVACSADPGRTFLGLVDPLELDPDFLRQVRNIRYRGAVAKVHLALDGLPTFAALSDGASGAAFMISPSLRYLERAYDDAKYGRVSASPLLEAFLPSVLDSTVAPAGKHVMSVLVQYAPYGLREGSWDDDTKAALARSVLATLEAHAPGMTALVTERHVLSPLDLESRFGLTGGNIHHGEMTLDQVLIGRPVTGWARYATPIDGLFLCGAGAHPGGGLTGSPGANAARTILQNRT